METEVKYLILGYQSNPGSQLYLYGGTYVNTSAVNALQFFMSTGNISTGNFYLYGIRKS